MIDFVQDSFGTRLSAYKYRSEMNLMGLCFLKDTISKLSAECFTMFVTTRPKLVLKAKNDCFS